MDSERGRRVTTGLIAMAISEDVDPREAYPLVDQVMVEDDAHDPLLDSYQ